MKNIIARVRRGLFRCRLALTLGAVSLFGYVAHAEGNSDSVADEITAKVKTWLDGIVESFKTFLTTNFTTIVTVLSIAVGFAVLWVIFKVFFKGAKKIG